MIREVRAEDNSALADVIRRVLIEFGANKPGFAWQDPSLDCMFESYSAPGHCYLVAIEDGKLLGGAGIGPLEGDGGARCELQKMYLLPDARGRGFGGQIIDRLLDWAKHRYQYCYLETLASMSAANRLYLHRGFQQLAEPLGCTGHGSCDTWYGKRLN
ncbi:GNAT family N-acetyltransferase [Corallincola platygyrae]|uniref:GNAT family N-acetyltransferase n=1 Tax=Corallincola platygyrae TaxID=1193278 RepID=A0ABW4XNE6_9GAMM